MQRSVKRVKLNWKHLEDVLTAHLYAIRAISPDDEVIEISLKKQTSTTRKHISEAEEFAVLDIHVLKGSK